MSTGRGPAPAVRMGLATLVLVVAGLSAAPLQPKVAAAAASGPFVTLLLGRSMWAQSEGGRAIPGQPTLVDLARILRDRGVRVTGVVVPGRTAERGVQYSNGNLYPSWTELAWLRDQFGWTFVSNGQNRLDITRLSGSQQVAESCGSLTAFERHGHFRAWGMYGPGSNRITDGIATNVVATCFAFTRYYDPGANLNQRSVVTKPPYYARTDDTHGGPCSLAPCPATGLTQRYMLPSELSQDLAAAGPDQWVLLSTYKLVTGSKLSGSRRWDCRASDPRKHWTNEVESWCLADLLSALKARTSNSVVTDPVGVARAWGRVPSSRG